MSSFLKALGFSALLMVFRAFLEIKSQAHYGSVTHEMHLPVFLVKLSSGNFLTAQLSLLLTSLPFLRSQVPL